MVIAGVKWNGQSHSHSHSHSHSLSRFPKPKANSLLTANTHPLLLENKIHRQHQEAETDQMVDRERLVLEENQHEDREDGQRQELLNHLKLPEVERASVLDEADTVCRNHETVFNEGDAPAEKNNQRQRQLAEPGRALQLQVTVPGKGHEHI